jgi:outer membrane receptor for Fe3+-dicitrate
MTQVKGNQNMSNAQSLIDFALGGWQANWIAIMESGQYFTPSFSGADPSNTNTTSGRPDRVRDGNLPTDQRTLEHWFDTTAFVVPKAGSYENTAQFALEGPGLYVRNLTVSKNFRAHERLNITVMSAIQNLFNHPTFATPAANISSPGTVGVISATRGYLGSRTIELRLRLQF